MSNSRTAWHPIFAALIKERAPPGIDVIPELMLTVQPQKADILLLRREAEARRDEEAKVLRGLWHRLSTDTLVEFKSVTRPLRSGDWITLLGYGAQYHSAQIERLPRAADLTLVLVVPSLTPTIRNEAAAMNWRIVARSLIGWPPIPCVRRSACSAMESKTRSRSFSSTRLPMRTNMRARRYSRKP